MQYKEKNCQHDNVNTLNSRHANKIDQTCESSKHRYVCSSLLNLRGHHPHTPRCTRNMASLAITQDNDELYLNHYNNAIYHRFHFTAKYKFNEQVIE